jgi:HK97 family phage portal protein
MTSTALARRDRPGILRRLRDAAGMALLRAQVTTTSTIGWTIVRGTSPSDFQGTGEELRLKGWERHPVVNACIRAIVDLIAAVPLEVYRKDAKGDATVLPRHELLDLFSGGNGGISEYRLKARTATYFLTYGNALWVLERNGRRSLPQRIRPVSPARLQFVWLKAQNDAIEFYDWRDLQGTVHAKTPAADVVHFRDLDAGDGLFGYPRGASALRSILADSEASEYVRQVVTNHGTPGIAVLLEGSPDVSELEGMRERWQQRWVERGGRGGAAFMGDVKDLKPLGFDLQQLEFPDLRGVAREDICAAFAVDGRIVGVSSGKSDGGLSGQQFAEARHRLIQQAVYPVMRCMEDEINTVLTPEYGEVYVRFSEEYIGAITEDVTQTSTRVLAEVGAKVRTIEEARDAIGLDPQMDPNHTFAGGMPVGMASDNVQQLAQATIENAKNPPPQQLPGNQPPARMLTRAVTLTPAERDGLWRAFDASARDHEAAFAAAATALFQSESRDVARILAALALTHAVADDQFVMAAMARIGQNYAPGGAYHQAWLDRYLTLIGKTVEAGGERIGLSFSLPNPRAEAVIRQRAADLVTNVTETTRAAIRNALLEGRQAGEGVAQIAARIERETFGEIAKTRAITIARTETVGALNAGAYQGAQQSGVMRSATWITQRDARVRDSHAALEGETVDIGAAFSNGLRYPHDPSGPPEEVINCRCTLAYSDQEAGSLAA